MDEESRDLTAIVTISEEKGRKRERERCMDLRMEGGTEKMYMKCVNRRDFEADLEMTDLRFGF
ncbi:unnamed protein product [Arabidopsis thaliana]|uniref:Uncharacterized protein n=1 Tax=Arabidopsis thaliana TaxID=3702 RepID=A0A5S9XTN3_ARATH|nr:unnamed protein product [Arabidopsis thaliana]VYS63148.1 unnamed protein product [Arabidopsis thaliana]